MRLSISQKDKINRAVKQHTEHKRSYFWTPFGCAATRQRTEQDNTWSVRFKHDGVIYEYCSEVSCSRNNYIYRAGFYRDGEKKDVRLFKELLTYKS